MTLPPVLTRLPRWIVLLLVAIVLRAITFGDPIVHVDESFYFVTARAMIHGALPFVDVWDRKPIGLFLLYAPAAALGVPAGIYAYQAMALAAATATAAMIARLADRAGWRRGALVAGIAYLIWLDMLEGQGGQAPVFYNLPMVVAAALIAPDAARDAIAGSRLWRGIAAMALVGIALQIKYSVVFEGAYFGLWWMAREWRARRSAMPVIAGAAVLAMVAALPTLAAGGYYAAIGHADAFLYANFRSIAARQPDPPLEQLGNIAEIVLITSPLYAAAILVWRRGDRAGLRGWAFGWLAAATFGLIVFGSWYDHYALPVLVPLCLCAAGFADDPRGRRAIPVALCLAFVAGMATTERKWQTRGTAADFGRVAAAVGTGPGCLYVYSGDAMLYTYSGRCVSTRYLFPSHLGRVRESGAVGVDQRAEIERILAQRPAVVVLRTPYPGERAELRALVLSRMAQDYRLAAQVPEGNDTISVFRRGSGGR